MRARVSGLLTRRALALLPMTLAIMVLMVGVNGRVVARFLTDVLGASLIATSGMSLAYIPALVASLASVRGGVHRRGRPA